MVDDSFKFVPFTQIGGRFKNYTISLGRHGGFGFNGGFYKKEGIKKYSHVLISYDNEKKAVGFLFTNDSNTTGAFKVTHGNFSASVVAHSFLAAYSIDPKIYIGKYIPKQFVDKKLGSLFYIILKENETL